MKLAIAVALVVWSGCQHDRGGNGGSAGLGTERGDCRPSQQCDPGLLCLSNLCVRPPPADCVTLAETVASMELGNYAEPEERAPIVSKYRGACETAMVSKDEGKCIAGTHDKWAAAQCAPRMFPEMVTSGTGDCGLVADKIKAFMVKQQGQYYAQNPQMKAYMETAIRVIKQSCTEDHWPDDVKQCALAADTSTGMDVMNTCNQKFPPELQQKMQARLQKAMQQVPPQ